MKKIALLLAMLLVISAAGCAPAPDDAFPEVDNTTRDGLLSFLASSALGGRGEYSITVDGAVGQETVGEVTGTVSGAPSGSEIISYSFLDNTLIEVSRTEVGSDGKWGPLTVLYGPKAMVLMEEDEVAGYWLVPQVFAMAPLTTVSQHKDFLVYPRESGLVALALSYAGKYQQAADLLAAMRAIHVENEGLPLRADVFGRPQSEGIDVGATAWAGYAAAVLAGMTDNDNLWAEARTYALYLRDLDVPDQVDARLAGWLLFSELVEEYPEFGYLPEQWQPIVGEEYDPLTGTWLLVSDQENLSDYVDLAYVPESPTHKWIHYNLLAALDKLPEELEADEFRDAPGGKAVLADGTISLEASAWMVLTVMGEIR